MAKKQAASAAYVRDKVAALLAETGWTKSSLRGLLEPARGKGKGGEFERTFCVDLSKWWTGGTRDDVFWRSSNSGGRASVRNKAGKATAGQCGDVAATDRDGDALLDLLTFELKRGYADASPMDCLDRLDGAAMQEFEGFLAQAIDAHERAGSYTWALVTRRDRRAACIWLPAHFVGELRREGGLQDLPLPRVRMVVPVRQGSAVGWHDLYGMHADHFFASTCRGHFERLGRRL